MEEEILTAQGLTKRYGHVKVVDGVDLHLTRGQIYGLIGRNGAGKTTIIRMVTAQTPITAGTVSLFGETTPTGLSKARSRMGAIVETPSFYPYLTAGENLEYYRRQRGIAGREAVADALERVGLAHTGKKKFKTFSLGMKQRLGLALALMNRPELLVLDEPINGLDPEGIVEVRNLLLELNRQYQTTVLISSHILAELGNIATHYGFLDKGHMLEQISAAELEEKCRACLELTVSDTAAAALVLEQALGTRDFEVLPGQVIRLYSRLDRPEAVTAALMAGGVALSGVHRRDVNLEDYFMALIGGERRG